MKYIWDRAKNGRNVRLHGVAFEDAARIFEGPTVEQVDDRFDYNEVRIYAIGIVNGLEITLFIRIGQTMKDASFQPGARQRTKGASTGKISTGRSTSSRSENSRSANSRPARVKSLHGTDWQRLKKMSDREIRRGIAADSDARPTDEKFWSNATVVLPQPKQIVTMRLDSDLLQWFRQRKGYQTRINAILRAYMSAHPEERA